MEQKIYNEYVEILKEELLPAMGCTEPIAVAYAAAVAVQALGEKPESVEVNVSANIIKNVKKCRCTVHRRTSRNRCSSLCRDCSRMSGKRTGNSGRDHRGTESRNEKDAGYYADDNPGIR